MNKDLRVALEGDKLVITKAAKQTSPARDAGRRPSARQTSGSSRKQEKSPAQSRVARLPREEREEYIHTKEYEEDEDQRTPTASALKQSVAERPLSSKPRRHTTTGERVYNNHPRRSAFKK